MTGFEGWVVGVEGIDRKNLKFFGRVEGFSGILFKGLCGRTILLL
jgi:hypothetical protein